MEVVVASSSIDGGIDYWDVHTGAEQLRYKTCVSPPHGLACVGQRFLASSQLRDPSANSGYILYWSWSKPIAATKARTSLVEVYLVIFTYGRLPLEDAVAKGDSSFVVKLQSTIKFNGEGHINHSIF